MMNLLLTVKYNRIVIYQHLEMQTPPQKKIKPSLSNRHCCKGYKTLQCCKLGKNQFPFCCSMCHAEVAETNKMKSINNWY